jgi:Cu-processing system permease protein
MSLIFTAIYYYNTYDFIELLVAQPLKRSQIFWGMFAGIALPLGLSLALSIFVPVLVHSGLALGLLFCLVVWLLNLVFIAVGMWIAVTHSDKTKGIGIAFLLWFAYSLLYDALVLIFLFAFSDYPLERPMVALVALNPIDLARVAVLLRSDNAALMGYTGAIYKDLFSSSWGSFLALVLMSCWAVLALIRSWRSFLRKDL